MLCICPRGPQVPLLAIITRSLVSATQTRSSKGMSLGRARALLNPTPFMQEPTANVTVPPQAVTTAAGCDSIGAAPPLRYCSPRVTGATCGHVMRSRCGEESEPRARSVCHGISSGEAFLQGIVHSCLSGRSGAQTWSFFGMSIATIAHRSGSLWRRLARGLDDSGALGVNVRSPSWSLYL